MNQKNIQFEKKFKKTTSLLYTYIKNDSERKKPLIPHLLRVGQYLFDHDYNDDIITAGLLHDILEWSDVPIEKLQNMYNDNILAIVKANTKNRNIADPHERRVDYIERCATVGKDALIVKAADVLDNFQFYTQTNNKAELERCCDIANLLIQKLDPDMQDPIFIELKTILQSQQAHYQKQDKNKY